jgi:glycosyltransferase involved in cell wall biosynthesis
VFNGENYLDEALDSILAQTYSDFELIISDNASTDRTEEICRAYAARDERVRYFRNETNLGVAKNYNRVFELSSGEYFKWAAHDDLCAPEYLERCVEILDREPDVVLCYPKTSIIDEHGEFVRNHFDGFNLRSAKPHERFRDFLHVHGLCNPIVGLIRARTLERTPLIGSYLSPDRVLLGELALRGKFYEVPERLFFRRDHPQRSMRANPDLDERLAWIDPARGGQIQLPRWRWLFEYLLAIRRVRLGWYEKLLCYVQMGRWVRWHWRKLKDDLVRAAKQILKCYLRQLPEI